MARRRVPRFTPGTETLPDGSHLLPNGDRVWGDSFRHSPRIAPDGAIKSMLRPRTGVVRYGPSAVWLDRKRFLEEVSKRAPRVLQELSGDLFSIYKTSAATFGMPEGLNPCLNDDWPPVPPFIYPAFAPLGAPFRAWLERWGIQVDWCAITALRTTDQWLTGRSLPLGCWASVPLDRSPEPLTAAEMAHQPALLHLPVWRPSGMAREDARRIIEDAFGEYLTDYLDRIEQLTEERGMRPFPETHNEEHWTWLVRYQVLGETLDEIAKGSGGEDSISSQAVSDAVRGLIRRIELPSKRGGRRSS